MACHPTSLRTRTPLVFCAALWLACSAIVAGPARAQEPAPATASSTAPPPDSWGGDASAAQPAQRSRSLADQPGGIKDTSFHDRPQMLSVFTGLHYGHFAGYGFPMMIGGRYAIPIVPDGFIPALNDEFALEFGMDLDFTFLSNIYSDSVLVGFGIPADGMWDFHFSPKFDAYAKLGFVFGSVFNSGYGGFWWTFRSAVGLRLKLNDAMYFRAEVGYPAIMAGLGFAM